jgi:hypothetical protein
MNPILQTNTIQGRKATPLALREKYRLQAQMFDNIMMRVWQDHSAQAVFLVEQSVEEVCLPRIVELCRDVL